MNLIDGYKKNRERIICYVILFFITLFVMNGVFAFVEFTPFVQKYIQNTSWLYLITGPFIAMFLTYMLRLKISRFLDKSLFLTKHLKRVQLARFDERLLRELELDKLSSVIVEEIGDIFHIKQLALFVFNEKQKEYQLQYEKGLAMTIGAERISEQHQIIESLLQKKKYIVYKKSYHFLSWQEAVLVDGFFEKYSAKTVFPFFKGDKLIGFLTMGEPIVEDESGYDVSDFYYVISKYAGFALENALQYSQLQDRVAMLEDLQGDKLQLLKFKSIETLATGVAHEIRNPLTIISLKAQTLMNRLKQGISTREIEATLKVFLEQIERASEISNRLISFSEPLTEKENVDTEMLLEEICDIVKFKASEKNIKFIRAIDPKVRFIMMNRNDLKEIFYNLIMNAVDSVEKEGSILIYGALQEESNRVEFYIADNGCGIKSEVQEADLIDPFFTSKEKGHAGLGLYQVQKIITRYQGGLRLDRNRKKGTIVSLKFPAKDVILSDELTEEAEEKSIDELMSFEAMKDIVFEGMEREHEKVIDS